MSFDLFVACWRKGEPAEFARTELDRILGADVTKRDDGFVRVAFPGGGADVYVDEGPSVHSLCVNRPGGEALLDAVVALASVTGSAVYWADGPPCLAVTDAGVVAHLPPDMVAELGPPFVVATGRDLLAAIEGGGPPASR